MKLLDYGLDAYVYSTSYRLCFPYTGMPSSTISKGDINHAVNFLWQRKSRRRLPDIHEELTLVIRCYPNELDRLYSIATMCYTYPWGRPRDGLRWLACEFEFIGEELLPKIALDSVFSFAPSRRPDQAKRDEAQSRWRVLARIRKEIDDGVVLVPDRKQLYGATLRVMLGHPSNNS